MATVERALLRGEKRIVLSGISWELYEQLRENEENWHVRMAYDKGRLEMVRRKKGLAVYVLGAGGKYAESEFSLNLPMLRVKELEPFLEFELAANETTWIRAFRAWVRERFPTI